MAHPASQKTETSKKRKKHERERKNRLDAKSIETTIHLSRHMKNVTHKKRAPRACKIVKLYARRMMKTTDNRIDVKLNKALWSRGIKSVPHRIRVRMARKVRERANEGTIRRGRGKPYTVISYVTPKDGTFKKKLTEVVDDE